MHMSRFWRGSCFQNTKFKTGTTLTFWFRKEPKAAYKKLNLSVGTKEAVAWYLEKMHMQQNMDYCCFSFAAVALGVSPDQESGKLSSEDPTGTAGEVIALFHDDEESTFAHAAICVEEDLYLSVYGVGGDLEASSLEDLKRDYRAPLVRVLRV
jgi:hypothetical protein